MRNELDINAYREHRRGTEIGRYDVVDWGLEDYSLTTARDYKDRAIIELLRESGGRETIGFKRFDPRTQRAKIVWYRQHPIGYYVWTEKTPGREREPCLRQLFVVATERGTGLGRLMMWDFFEAHREADPIWIEAPRLGTCKILEKMGLLKKEGEDWDWSSRVRRMAFG
ncbi:MAG: hypothetical protein ISF22_07575 [Methanomassiliicoccus sp.]|nr:hypothetical protein [Methanomassiliicoccus sp.]